MKRSATSNLKKHQAREERVSAALPVLINGKTGVTRDISASGIYFHMDDDAKPGSTINFHIDLDTPGGKLSMVCKAQVVRVDKEGGRSGVAAKIISQTLESATQATAAS